MKVLIEWLKEFFGIVEAKPAKKETVRKEPVTKKVVAKGPKKATKASLNKLTKAQLEVKGRELGIELDKRQKKSALVDEVFKAELK
jgi:hypothetical protein